MKETDRRSFLKIAGSSLGIGVLYSAYPTAALAAEGKPRRAFGLWWRRGSADNKNSLIGRLEAVRECVGNRVAQHVFVFRA